MPALTPTNRSVAAWTCLWHAVLALLLVVGGGFASAVGMEARPEAASRAAHAAADRQLPTGATIAADADAHEECALVESAPETSEDEVAIAWPNATEDLGGRARARAQATMGVRRQAPAWRKSARGPPAAAS